MTLFKNNSDWHVNGFSGTKSPDAPDISPARLVYEDAYQKIYNLKADFGSYEREYFIRESGSRAGLLAFKDGCLLLVRQYRLFINRLSYEIPGGKVDEGENPEQAAVRECLEETGVRCSNLKPVIFYHLALDAVHCPTYIFHSNQISDLHEGSKIHCEETNGWEWVPWDRCVEMIKNGEILDSFTILGILSHQTFIKDKE